MTSFEETSSKRSESPHPHFGYARCLAQVRSEDYCSFIVPIKFYLLLCKVIKASFQWNIWWTGKKLTRQIRAALGNLCLYHMLFQSIRWMLHISLDKSKLWPAGGAIWKFRGSPLGFIFWGPWMSVQFHGDPSNIYFQSGPKWRTDRPSPGPLARLKRILNNYRELLLPLWISTPLSMWTLTVSTTSGKKQEKKRHSLPVLSVNVGTQPWKKVLALWTFGSYFHPVIFFSICSRAWEYKWLLGALLFAPKG